MDDKKDIGHSYIQLKSKFIFKSQKKEGFVQFILSSKNISRFRKLTNNHFKSSKSSRLEEDSEETEIEIIKEIIKNIDFLFCYGEREI